MSNRRWASKASIGVAQGEAAHRDIAETPPVSIRFFEHIPHDLPGLQVSFPFDAAPVLDRHGIPSFVALFDDHQYARQDIDRLESRYDGGPAGLRDGPIGVGADDRAHMSRTEESVHLEERILQEGVDRRGNVLWAEKRRDCLSLFAGGHNGGGHRRCCRFKPDPHEEDVPVGMLLRQGDRVRAGKQRRGCRRRRRADSAG